MDQPPEQVVEIVTNLDDVSGEVLGDAMQCLLDSGALDVWCTPIVMKKNRPGVTLSVLCAEADQPRLARRIVELTGTFGLRYRPWDRVVLARRHETVHTAFGPIRVKVGMLDGREVSAKPEFEDVKQAALEHSVAMRHVMDAVANARNHSEKS